MQFAVSQRAVITLDALFLCWQFFVFCHGFLQLSQLLVSGYLKSSISTIERRYGLSSQTSGLLASFNEVKTSLLLVVYLVNALPMLLLFPWETSRSVCPDAGWKHVADRLHKLLWEPSAQTPFHRLRCHPCLLGRVPHVSPPLHYWTLRV